MNNVKTLLVIAHVLVSTVGAQQPTTTPEAVFKALTGSWACAGGFPDGRQLAADLTFTATRGGRLLHFTHDDRAPSTYWQDAIWLFDAKANRILSLSSGGLLSDSKVSAALLVSKEWTDAYVVLEADSLKGPPWAANRFAYSLRGASELLMRWELLRNGAWTLGDSLICRRSKTRE